MKNYFLLIIIILLSFGTFAQNKNSFVLKGEIENLQKGDTLLVRPWTISEFEKVKNQTFIANQDNSFSLIIPTKHSQYYQLTHSNSKNSNERNTFVFFAKPGETISLTKKKDTHSSIKGGVYDIPLYARFANLFFLKEYEESNFSRKIKEAIKNNDDETANRLYEEYSKLQNDFTYHNLMDSIAKNVKDSEFAVLMYLTTSYSWDYQQGNAHHQQLHPKVKSSYYGKLFAQILKKEQKVSVGVQAPKFTLTSSTGKKVSLSDYKGKYLLMYYWTPLCGACISTRPEIDSIYEKYAKQLDVLSITPSPKETHLEQQAHLFETEGMKEKYLDPPFNKPWNLVFTSDEKNKKALEVYRLQAFPTLTLISPEGKILFKTYTDTQGLERVLAEHLL
ncbi:peroxiredoxin family protein [Capnocytophaga stomatis]|uniref:peroxiredoxin family protein n=1 Tax=Capnocytophaga stomatis TaxID=1848904 RepID=UPI00385B12CB